MKIFGVVLLCILLLCIPATVITLNIQMMHEEELAMNHLEETYPLGSHVTLINGDSNWVVVGYEHNFNNSKVKLSDSKVTLEVDPKYISPMEERDGSQEK